MDIARISEQVVQKKRVLWSTRLRRSLGENCGCDCIFQKKTHSGCKSSRVVSRVCSRADNCVPMCVAHDVVPVCVALMSFGS